MLFSIEDSFFTSKSYFITSDIDASAVVIVDPCGDGIEIVEWLRGNNRKPDFIFLTHEHIDHISGVNLLKNTFPDVCIVCSFECAERIIDSKLNLSHYWNRAFCCVPADLIVHKRHTLRWKEYEFNFFQVQGHSKGGMLINAGSFLFCGDEFIKNKKTVTKLPGGNWENYLKSVEFVKAEFDPGTLIYPGHGLPFFLNELQIW